ncbi:MAG: protein-tyrosine phosphatase family protein [Vibrionaceae bacterium]
MEFCTRCGWLDAHGTAINLPARENWQQDDHPDAGAAAPAISRPRAGSSTQGLVFPESAEMPQTSQGFSFNRLLRRLKLKKDKSVSTPDLRDISQTTIGSPLPDLSQTQKSDKRKGRLGALFSKKKSVDPVSGTKPKIVNKDQISLPIPVDRGVQASTSLGKVITQGAVAWDYPDYTGMPVTSYKTGAIEQLRKSGRPGAKQAEDLKSQDSRKVKAALTRLLRYQREHRNMPDGAFAPYDPSSHRFKDIRPMRSTLINTSAGQKLGINNMVVNNKVVGMACSLPTDVQFGEMYNFMFEHGMQGLHAIIQDTDLQRDKTVCYFEPVITPVNSPTGYNINIATNQMEIDPEGIVTSGGRIKVEKEETNIYDEGHPSETKVFNLILTRGDEVREIKVLHSPCWVDATQISSVSLARLLELRENCFLDLSPDRILTHCRAGIGRTGTILTAEVMRHMLGLNLLDIVMSLRDSRHSSVVQTEGQIELLMNMADELQYPLLDSGS